MSVFSRKEKFRFGMLVICLFLALASVLSAGLSLGFETGFQIGVSKANGIVFLSPRTFYADLYDYYISLSVLFLMMCLFIFLEGISKNRVCGFITQVIVILTAYPMFQLHSSFEKAKISKAPYYLGTSNIFEVFEIMIWCWFVIVVVAVLKLGVDFREKSPS